MCSVISTSMLLPLIGELNNMWKGLWQNEYDMRFEISTHNSYRNRELTSLPTSPIIGITSASPAGELLNLD